MPLRAVVQRVSRARVSVDGRSISEIGCGYVVLVGVAAADTARDARWLAAKVAGLRVFPDDEGKMNRPVRDAGGAVLAVSQFTLMGDARKGRRPSFVAALVGDEAERLFELFAQALRDEGVPTETGVFGAHMDVELVNDGPVTILLDSEKTF